MPSSPASSEPPGFGDAPDVREAFRASTPEYARSFAIDFTPDGLRYADLDPRRVNLLGVAAQWVDATDVRALRDRFPPEAGPDAAAWARWCHSTKRPLAYETCLDDRPPGRGDAGDAGPRWWLTQLAPLVSERGAVWRIIGAVTPITERKRLQQKLRRRERRTQLLYDLAARRDEDPDVQLQHALNAAREELRMDVGLVLRTTGTTAVVEAAAPLGCLAPHARFRLATLCAHHTLDAQTLVLQAGPRVLVAGARPLVQPGLDAPPRRYLGLPLRVHGRTYGTLSFASVADGPVDDGDGYFVRQLAQWVESTLEVQRRERALRRMRELMDQSQRIARVGGWLGEAGRDGLEWTAEMYRLFDVPYAFEPTLARMLAFFDEADRVAIERALVEAQVGHRPIDVEATLTTETGTRRRVHLRGRAERARGQPTRVWGSLQDVMPPPAAAANEAADEEEAAPAIETPPAPATEDDAP